MGGRLRAHLDQQPFEQLDALAVERPGSAHAVVGADVDPVDRVLASAVLVDEQPVEQLDVHAIQRACLRQPVVGIHVEPVERQV